MCSLGCSRSWSKLCELRAVAGVVAGGLTAPHLRFPAAVVEAGHGRVETAASSCRIPDPLAEEESSQGPFARQVWLP